MRLQIIIIIMCINISAHQLWRTSNHNFERVAATRTCSLLWLPQWAFENLSATA